MDNEVLNIELEKEKSLMLACAAGDRHSYNLLYRRHIQEVLRYVYLFTKSWDESEELVQELFIKIWEKRESLSYVDSFRAYTYRMAKNKVIDRVRHQKVRGRFEEELEECVGDQQSDFDLIYNQYYDLAQRAIALLPEKRRVIFDLKTEKDLSLDEIAERLSISKSVVKKQWYAGSQFVREYLKKHGDIVADLCLLIYFFAL